MVSEKLIICEYSAKAQLAIATFQLLVSSHLRYRHVVTAHVSKCWETDVKGLGIALKQSYFILSLIVITEIPK